LREEFGTPIVDWEILHGGEGGDVEQGARTSKHILVFAFDPLSLEPLLSFILCKASSISTFQIISFACTYSYCLCCLASFTLLIILICLACLCVCLTYT